MPGEDVAAQQVRLPVAVGGTVRRGRGAEAGVRTGAEGQAHSVGSLPPTVAGCLVHRAVAALGDDDGAVGEPAVDVLGTQCHGVDGAPDGCPNQSGVMSPPWQSTKWTRGSRFVVVQGTFRGWAEPRRWRRTREQLDGRGRRPPPPDGGEANTRW